MVSNILHTVLLAASLLPLAHAAPADTCKYKGALVNWQLFKTCNHVCNLYTPTTVAEAQAIVRNSLALGRGVKAVGARHSYTDNLCKENADFIDMTKLHNIISINKDEGWAYFEAGTTFGALEIALKKEGMTYGFAAPAWPLITVGGALANSAHGSGWTTGGPITVPAATLAVDIINPQGELETITDGDKLAAIKTNLGLLGVVVRIKYAVHPSRKMRYSLEVVSDKDAIADGLLSIVEKQAGTIGWYIPSFQTIALAKMSHADDYSGPLASGSAITNTMQTFRRNVLSKAIACKLALCPSPISNSSVVPVVGLEEDVIGGVSAVYGDILSVMGKFGIVLPIGVGDDEYALPISRHQEAIAAVKATFKEYHDIDISIKGVSAALPFVEIRFAPAEDTAYLALNTDSDPAVWGQGTVWIEVWFLTSEANENQIGKFRNALQARLLALGARPHWGKTREVTFQGGVRDRYNGNFAKFEAVRHAMDSKNTFMNEFATRAGIQ